MASPNDPRDFWTPKDLEDAHEALMHAVLHGQVSLKNELILTEQDLIWLKSIKVGV